MRTEQIGEYDVEYAGVWLAEVQGWAAFVTIYGPSPNPMHRHSVLPRQQVAVETVFGNEQEAQAEARQAAIAMLEHTHGAH